MNAYPININPRHPPQLLQSPRIVERWCLEELRLMSHRRSIIRTFINCFIRFTFHVNITLGILLLRERMRLRRAGGPGPSNCLHRLLKANTEFCNSEVPKPRQYPVSSVACGGPAMDSLSVGNTRESLTTTMITFSLSSSRILPNSIHFTNLCGSSFARGELGLVLYAITLLETIWAGPNCVE